MEIINESSVYKVRVGDVLFGSCVQLDDNELYLVCDNEYSSKDGKTIELGLPNLKTGRMKIVSTDERVVVREAQIVIR